MNHYRMTGRFVRSVNTSMVPNAKNARETINEATVNDATATDTEKDQEELEVLRDFIDHNKE
jgi:hypothetical protein